MKKIIFTLVFLLLISSCMKKSTIEAHPKKEELKVQKNNKTKEISIIAVGDIMLGSSFPSQTNLPNKNILEHVKDILIDADITVGNLEGTLFDGYAQPKKCSNPNICFAFKTPASYGKYLKNAGFDYLSIANNHSNDFGETGIIKTAQNLDKFNIKYAGIKDKFEYSILEKKGIKFGFISFSPNNKTVNLNDYEYAKKLIKEVRKKVDILIIMFHGGAEGNGHQHVPRRKEIFFGENRGDVFKFSRFAIDNGADLIFGQGPHVTRSIELYKDRFISYSAGNFATYGLFNLQGANGIAPIFKIYINEKGEFIKGKIIPVEQKKGIGPKIDTDNKVIKKIIQLNAQDFPEGNNLIVTETGDILIK